MKLNFYFNQNWLHFHSLVSKLIPSTCFSLVLYTFDLFSVIKSCPALCDPMKSHRQEYWSGLPFPSPRDLPDPGTKPASPALQADYLPLSHQGSPVIPAGCPLNQDGQCIPRRCVGFGVHSHRQAPVSPPLIGH